MTGHYENFSRVCGSNEFWVKATSARAKATKNIETKYNWKKNISISILLYYEGRREPQRGRVSIVFIWRITPKRPCNKFYKITKIVRALWLAERSVCMRVCKHGCGVKLFGFSRANHASTNLKKFSSSKLDKSILFTHSFVGWNMENRYKEGESIFLCLSWHSKREKSVFCKASFCKTRTDYACKTSWTRFCDW